MAAYEAGLSFEDFDAWSKPHPTYDRSTRARPGGASRRACGRSPGRPFSERFANECPAGNPAGGGVASWRKRRRAMIA